jgi:hypothetical protein
MRQNTGNESGILGYKKAGRNFPALIYWISFLVLFPFALYQIFHLSIDMIFADGSIDKLIVQPRYNPLRVPENPITARYNAVGRLGADLAQVYFPSQDISRLEEGYSADKTSDPWNRPSRYAPFVHFICALSICRLPYGYAGVVHIFVQFFFFLAGFVIAFKELQILKYLPPALFVIIICLFLSPTGLSWFERGQFSLYVALSYLSLFLAVVKERKEYAVFSALFAFIKWTSLPYLVLFFCVYLLTPATLAGFRKRAVLFVAFVFTMELMLLFFAKNSILFLAGLVSQEMYAPAFGISLARILPRVVVKLLPVLLILLGCFLARRKDSSMVELTPYFTGSVIILLTFPAIAFEYNILSVFGLIPFVIFWSTLPHTDQLSGNILLGTFLLFIILASFSVNIFQSEVNIIVFHILMSLICISISFFQNQHVLNNTADSGN